MFPKLKIGDQIDVLAPSSFIKEEDELVIGLEILKSWGLKIKQYNSLSKRFSYFAGDDNTRFEELEEAQNSKLIIFAKGGWGSARLLEKNPSWRNGYMLGFSDTCSLLLSKYSQGFYGSIHGPMVTSLAKEPEWSIKRLKNLLFEGYIQDIKGIPLKKGKAKGEIIVSNLTIATFLIGTNHFPDVRGKIVIFEDINEDIYKIDRMLTYLRMTKIFSVIAGIGFGSFSSDISSREWGNLLQDLVMERLKEFNFPILFNLPIGHISGNACIPIGYEATLNGNDGTLSIHIPHND